MQAISDTGHCGHRLATWQVIGVDMMVNRVSDPQFIRFGEVDIALNITFVVDHDRGPSVASSAENIGRAPRTVVKKLFKDHGSLRQGG